MKGEDDEYALSRKLVARSFGTAAENYQQANQLQQTVAERLLERLEYITLAPQRVLDLGSGPGLSSARLARLYRKSQIMEVDISLPMLHRAARQAPRFFSRRQRLCADAGKLPVQTASINMVFSNLMLQWCDNLDAVFSEVRRILRPNGLFIFSTFGPDTLLELRQSWRQADESVHVNAFVDMHDIGDALIRTGMENPVMESEKITVRYDEVFALMRDLKKLGAHNINKGRRKTLTGKSRMKTMLGEYEKWRDEGKLPASYEIVYGHAWSPLLPTSIQVDKQTAVFPVAALKQGQLR